MKRREFITLIGGGRRQDPGGGGVKTLFLIRHAKSSWDDPALPDKDRPLGDRGRRDAPKMGKRLAKGDVEPDLILSSPARRALKTAEIIASFASSATSWSALCFLAITPS
jgi:phosphohistidine phosphatase SixA